MRNFKFVKLGLVATLPTLALALAGCGGSSINGGSPVTTQPSDPTIYGINTTDYNTLSVNAPETSGFGSPDGTIAYPTGAQDSTANAIPQIADGFGSSGNSTIALGFASGGQYGNPGFTFFPTNALTPGQPVIFGSYISNGQNTKGKLFPITSANLTSTDPEWTLGTLPLSFIDLGNSTPSGPLGGATYKTSTFNLPFTSSGIHTVNASVTDSNNTTTNTIFNSIVLNPSDGIGAVVVQALVSHIIGSNNSPTIIEASPYAALAYGANANFLPAHFTITGQVATNHPYIPQYGPSALLTAYGFTSLSTYTPQAGDTDQNGVAVLFATPGLQTIRVTGIDPSTGDTVSGTLNVTVAAGKVTTTLPDGQTPLAITLALPTGSVQQAHVHVRTPRRVILNRI